MWNCYINEGRLGVEGLLHFRYSSVLLYWETLLSVYSIVQLEVKRQLLWSSVMQSKPCCSCWYVKIQLCQKLNKFKICIHKLKVTFYRGAGPNSTLKSLTDRSNFLINAAHHEPSKWAVSLYRGKEKTLKFWIVSFLVSQVKDLLCWSRGPQTTTAVCLKSKSCSADQNNLWSLKCSFDVKKKIGPKVNHSGF